MLEIGLGTRLWEWLILHEDKRPLGITLIGYFYVFGAAVLLIAWLLNNSAGEFGIAARFGVPGFPESAARLLVAAFSLLMAYGYLSLKPWGFWLMMGYSLLFFLISACLSLQLGQQPFYGNTVWSMVVLGYTFLRRDHFAKAVG